jgi:hypothetical protein
MRWKYLLLVTAVMAALIAVVVVQSQGKSKPLVITSPKGPVSIGTRGFVTVKGTMDNDENKSIIVLLYAPGVAGFYRFEQFTMTGGAWSTGVGPIGAATDPVGSYYKLELFAASNGCDDAIWALPQDSSGAVHMQPLPKSCTAKEWSNRIIIRVNKTTA